MDKDAAIIMAAKDLFIDSLKHSPTVKKKEEDFIESTADRFADMVIRLRARLNSGD